MAARSSLPYDIDGAVVKVDDFTALCAWKHRKVSPVGRRVQISSGGKADVLKSIEVNVGRTSVLTPTGIFEPVTLAGTTVSRRPCTIRILVMKGDMYRGYGGYQESRGYYT